MYDYYSINEILFYWQSQSTTPDTFPAGQRNIIQSEQESKVVIALEGLLMILGEAAPYTLHGCVTL